MNRTTSLPRTLFFTALAAVTFVGVAACSSDTNKTTVDDVGTDVVTLPPGVTLPAGVVLPGADDCRLVYGQFLLAVGAAFNPSALADINTAFGDVSSKVPAELQDEVAILSAAFRGYGEILTANNSDQTSPEVQAALAALATPEVEAASQTVQAYFEETCPEAF